MERYRNERSLATTVVDLPARVGHNRESARIPGGSLYVDDIEAAIAGKTLAAEAQVTSLVRRILVASLAVVALRSSR